VLQCAVAKSEGKTLLTAIAEGVKPRIKVIGNEYSIPNICRHCEYICVANCPTEALRRTEDGIVLIDEDKCNKCLLCISVCPFDVPKVVEETIIKCDLCYNRLLEGKVPFCVEGCPVDAIEFKEPGMVTERKYILLESFTFPARRYEVELRADESPKQIFDRVKAIERTGRIFEVTITAKKKRRELGLPPLPRDAVEELHSIVKLTGLFDKMARIRVWKVG
jgi:Fe-S-cluster-containing dehydrogenase component